MVSKASQRRSAQSADIADDDVDNSQFVDLNHLEWSKVSPATDQFLGVEVGDADLGGFYCLEEISDVECTWLGDDASGRTCMFKKTEKGGKNGHGGVEDVRSRKKKRKMTNAAASGRKANVVAEEPLPDDITAKFIDIDTFTEDVKSVASVAPMMEQVETSSSGLTESPAPNSAPVALGAKLVGRLPDSVAIPVVDMSKWEELGLSETVLNGLRIIGYTTPTEIQAMCVPSAAGHQRKDIIGAAETGSGKTLAFGLPIISYVTRLSPRSEEPNRGLTALILTPTRELAMQVKDHLVAVSRHTHTFVAVLVGGMSLQKQERILARKPDIIVATPGRLWELITTDEHLSHDVRKIRFLVLDEADRMMEGGHFQELKDILNTVSRRRVNTGEDGQEIASAKPPRRQTFVFSATLGSDKSYLYAKSSGGKAFKKAIPGSLEDLMQRIEFDDSNPLIVDITNPNRVAVRLTEARIDCLQNDKDIYLYYFLTRFPGRTLVFVNSIDGARRLLAVLRNLSVTVFCLHAQMQQRQRLKSMDRFKSSRDAIMVASDVAARGLDIPLVDHVVHFDVPRTADTYVHRSGRTARAGQEGMSIIMCSPEESSGFKKLCFGLNKAANSILEFPIDLSLMAHLKQRVVVARKIDGLEHTIKKEAREQDWFVKNANALDIEFDVKSLKRGSRDDDDHTEKAQTRAKVKMLRVELAHLMVKNVIPAGSSAKYITSGLSGHNLPTKLISGTGLKGLPGHDAVKAIAVVRSKKQKRK